MPLTSPGHDRAPISPIAPPPQLSPSALRAFLLDILLLSTLLIILGAIVNAIAMRRRDRQRRAEWVEYWGNVEGGWAGQHVRDTQEEREALIRRGEREVGGWGTGEEEVDAPPRYEGRERDGRVLLVAEDLRRGGERLPGYEEATKGDEGRGEGGSGSAGGRA